MNRAIIYFIECYLHQDWDVECGSSKIEDSYYFYFQNECDDDCSAHITLAQEMISDISELLKNKESAFTELISHSNYRFDTYDQNVAWMKSLCNWCVMHITAAKYAQENDLNIMNVMKSAQYGDADHFAP